MDYNNGGDTLTIKTSLGTLEALVGHDPTYPEYYITLITDDGYEFPLVVVGEDNGSIKTRVKEFLPCEDFTDTVEFTKGYIDEAVETMKNDFMEVE